MKKIIISLSVALTTLLSLQSNESTLASCVKPALYATGAYALAQLAYHMGEYEMTPSWHYTRVGAVGLGAFATTKAVETLFNPQSPFINTVEAACAGFGAALLYHATIPFITKVNITRLYNHISGDKLTTYINDVQKTDFKDLCTAISPVKKPETRFILLTRLSKIESLQETINRGSFYINNELDQKNSNLENQRKKISNIISLFNENFESENQRIPVQKPKNRISFIQLIHDWVVALEKTMSK